MLRLIGRRVLVAIPLVVVVTFIVFVLIDLAPGDPAVTLAGENPDPARVAYLREQLHLDDSVVARWASWFGNALHGDLGQSLQTRQSVADLIWSRLTVTVSLLVVALVIATFVALTLGVVGALRPRGIVDRGVTMWCSVGLAVPPFWVGIMLVSWFAVDRHWFPAVGYAPLAEGFGPWLERLILPGIAVSCFLAAELALQLKGALTEALGSDYVLAAEAKGLGRRPVIFKHALKNAGVPVATVAGLRIAGLIGGTATVESVFALRGIGDLAVGATLNRDVTVMLGVLLVTSVIVQIVNLVVDVSYGYFNPRVRT
jgi:peptide/nickel transport system permease protein